MIVHIPIEILMLFPCDAADFELFFSSELNEPFEEVKQVAVFLEAALHLFLLYVRAVRLHIGQ